MNLSSIKDFMKTNKPIKLIVIPVALIILTCVAIFYYFGISKTDTKHLFAMDTAVTITADKNNLNTYSDKIESLDKMLSAYNANSEISRLNKDKNGCLSAETADLINQAVKLTEKYPDVDITAGALVRLWKRAEEKAILPTGEDIASAQKTVSTENIRINGDLVALESNAQIDLGSCAKGYALDVLCRLFEENKESYAIVSFGSSSLVYGEKPDGKAFTTEIVNPDNTNSSVLRFKTEQAFISTSGGYERYFQLDGKKYSHIIDLSTGRPVETDLVSVTVISKDSGITSDFMSTCVYIGGTEKLSDYIHSKDFEIIAIDKNKNVYCSDSIKDRVEIIDNEFKLK